MNWEHYENFEDHNFDCKDGCGKNNMNPSFMRRLQAARTIADIPFYINSGSRCEDNNREEGGVSDSAHLGGRAADIRCSTSRNRAIIIKAAMMAGFTRIGIGNTFIHLDNDSTKDPDVYWLY